MQIQIVNKNIDVSPAIRERISDRLDDMMDKYIHREGDAHVAISKEGSGFRVTVDVHLPSGVSMQGTGQAQDAYAAADEALGHTEKRLRRYKRRLKDHHRDRVQPVELSDAGSYILESREETEGADHDDATPIIIAEMESKIPSLSVGEAVMQMEIASAPVLVFRNEKNNEVNVVYRREDGNIGWVDPKTSG